MLSGGFGGSFSTIISNSRNAMCSAESPSLRWPSVMVSPYSDTQQQPLGRGGNGCNPSIVANCRGMFQSGDVWFHNVPIGVRLTGMQGKAPTSKDHEDTQNCARYAFALLRSFVVKRDETQMQNPAGREG